MNEYLYEEQLKYERFEMLVNTKEVLTKEDLKLISELMDGMAKNGMILAKDFTLIGGVYNKVIKLCQ